MGIVIAAILMFIGTGSIVMPKVVLSLKGLGGGPDNILAAALILNIALIIFGWRRYIDLAREVEAHRLAEEEALTLASTDPLTGIFNRRSLVERTASLIAQTAGKRQAVAYFLFDVDNFKTINDVHGHAVGDLVLQTMTQRLTTTMPQNSVISRLGGDEFGCALFFDPAHPETVEKLAGHLIDILSRPIGEDGSTLQATVSVGIARSESSQDHADGLMRRADIAMYYSKRGGRNRFAWFDKSMEDEIRMRNDLETGIRTGIEKGEFVPFYEQQINLDTGKLIGFEVLARWNSPVLGFVSPDVFIPVAEETGMIGELSLSIMQQAMEHAVDWDDELTISVNISPIQLRDPWLAQKILKLLVATGLPPARLEIEITESCLFENIGLAQSIIGSLKNQGVRIALDDFGTGYSSLAHLRALPFDRIKIDRSFITSLVTNKESAAIVQAISSLGSSMNLPITAEGIENQEILEKLRQIGCGKGQGYLYGEPLNVDQTRRMLAKSHLIAQTPQVTASEPGMQDEAAKRARTNAA